MSYFNNPFFKEITMVPKLKPLRNVEIVEGDDIILETRASGIPKPTVKWFKSHKKVVNSEKFALIEDKKKWRLRIKECTKSDAGLIVAKARNTVGCHTAHALLYVKGIIYK